MAPLKRKRNAFTSSAYAVSLKPKPSYYKKRRFTPGKDRVGGFYGRYAGRDSELKFHDVDLDDAVITLGGQITETINIIPQGVTESQRIGRKCTIKQILWHYQLNLPEADAVANPPNPDAVRVIMYLDKQANGAAAAVTDIIESADWQSFRNLANSSRFTILLDRMVQMNYDTMASDGAGLVSTSKVNWDLTFYKNCNIPLEFNSTTGAMSEIRSNNLGVLLLGQNGVAGFGSKIRLRYSDS